TELKIWAALTEGNTNDARKQLEEAFELPREQRARLWQRLGDTTNSVKLAKDILNSSTNKAPGLALATHLLWQCGETNAAGHAFGQLRGIPSRCDLASPIFARLSPVAQSLGLPEDWRLAAAEKSDVGLRPVLDTLGPFRWQPYLAPGWTLSDGDHRS